MTKVLASGAKQSPPHAEIASSFLLAMTNIKPHNDTYKAFEVERQIAMDLLEIGRNDPRYPASLEATFGAQAPASLAALGNPDLLTQEMLALFCSVKCPGKLILETYDLAQRLRHAGITVISGFHSPMERECLVQLLRGSQPIVVCPARNIKGMRIAAEYKEPLERGQLLFLSPFTQNQRRSTVEMAVYRNRFVATLAGRVFVAYAEPGGKTEQFCREVLGHGKPLYMLQSDSNADLIALGARPIMPEDAAGWS